MQMNENDLKNLIDELVSLPAETGWVEFKLDRFREGEVGEYISALSNSACLENKPRAYLVFGIEDRTHQIVGTKVNLKEKKIGNEELENWLVRMLLPRIDFKIHSFYYDSCLISLISIDPASNQPVRFKNTSYIRIGSYKRKLTDFPEKERKIWNNSISEETFESRLCLKRVNEDTILRLLDYPSYFKLMQINLPSNKDAILKKLCEDKLIEETEKSYHITNMGAILFAADLKEFDSINRKAIRVIFYKGKDRLNAIKEQIDTKGYAAGFEGLIEFINDRLPTNEELDKVFRREIKMYPEIVIRELVANALIHQDFSIKGCGPMIEIFSNRIEISNPGKPLVETLRFIDHSPISRNEKIANLMRRMNICEERGSGIDKVITFIEVAQLPAPDFIENETFFKVIVYAPKSLRQMDKKDKTRACYQHCALKHVIGEKMTNASLRERLNIEEKNYATASRIISDTIDAGLIKEYDTRNKSKKFARYVPFWA
jgi:predicted HTH transcriptional regulator